MTNTLGVSAGEVVDVSESSCHGDLSTRSTSRPCGLVVILRVPLERAEKLDDPALFAPCDELLERPFHRRCLRALAADRNRSVEKIGINRKVGGHVRMIAQ